MQLAQTRRALIASIRHSWRGMLIGGLLAAPIAMYIRTFGFQISTKHNVWAEMGSAMSGIYGPILAVLTFFVLIMQVRLQAQTNKHAADQAHLLNARADIEFYLVRLAEGMDQPTVDGYAPADVLHRAFKFASMEDLAGEELQNLAKLIDKDAPQLQAMWGTIYSVLAGLQSEGVGNPFDLQFMSALQKAIAMLSFPTCAALDHYLYCVTGDRVRYPYQFSTQLSARQGVA